MTPQDEIKMLEEAIASHQDEINRVNQWLDKHRPTEIIEDWLLAQMDYRENQIKKIEKCIEARRQQ